LKKRFHEGWFSDLKAVLFSHRYLIFTGMKFRKSRKLKGGSSTTQKNREPFLRPKEGNESSFLRPQARILAGENPLPESVQARMEQTLGEDFSSVKINQQSSEAAQMGAMAYTNGENVHFAPGMYNPHTASGQELIGHELTHVKQQRQGRVQPEIQAKGLSLNNDRALEAEADHFGKKAATTEAHTSSSGIRRDVSTSVKNSKGVVQMKTDEKTAYLTNNSSHTIYYKPENTSEALPLKPGGVLYEPIDGAATSKYNDAVIKIPSGADLTITSDGGADIDFYGLGGIVRIVKYGWITVVPDSGWSNLFEKARAIGARPYHIPSKIQYPEPGPKY
jgi:hypothetical protein